MKINFFYIFKFFATIIIIAKISTWFLDYDKTLENIINSAMFSLIGIFIGAVAYFAVNKNIKLIFFICAIYLVAMNFFEKTAMIFIGGILAMLIPILIGRFSKEFKNLE